MPFFYRSLLRLLASSALSLSPLVAFPQAAAPPASVPLPSATRPVGCAPMANIAIPSRAAIEAKVTGLDSAHLKPNSEIWFKIARPFFYPGCLSTQTRLFMRTLSQSVLLKSRWLSTAPIATTTIGSL